MRISIMQPAFCPPASYFRLFAASDLFVVFDSAQFDRRWFTHRQKFTNDSGEKEWLTLPLKKLPRDTTMIKDLEWADDYQELWLKQLDKFTDVEHFPIPDGMTPLMFICSGLFNTCNVLSIPLKVAMASSIPIPEDLRGQNRIIAICNAVGATHYLNSPGGKELYNAEDFSKQGITLEFLKEWTGSYDSVIERLVDENPEDIRKEIYAQI